MFAPDDDPEELFTGCVIGNVLVMSGTVTVPVGFDPIDDIRFFFTLPGHPQVTLNASPQLDGEWKATWSPPFAGVWRARIECWSGTNIFGAAQGNLVVEPSNQ